MDQKHSRPSHDDARDDADVRGEHEYEAKRTGSSKPTPDEPVQQRRPGHYVAGADGMQDVREQTDEEGRDAPDGGVVPGPVTARPIVPNSRR